MPDRLTDEYMQARGAEAYDRICAMAAEGIDAAIENKGLRERVHTLELDNQRLRFEIKAERNLKRLAYLQSQEFYQERNRLLDVMAGRVELGKVDASLLTRGILEIIKWSNPDNAMEVDE